MVKHTLNRYKVRNEIHARGDLNGYLRARTGQKLCTSRRELASSAWTQRSNRQIRYDGGRRASAVQVSRIRLHYFMVRWIRKRPFCGSSESLPLKNDFHNSLWRSIRRLRFSAEFADNEDA